MDTAAEISKTRLREIERSAQETVNRMSQVGRSIRNAFGVVGIGVGVSSVIAGFRRMVAEAIDFGDEMQKASLRTGLGAAQFAELAAAAKLADVEVETLSKAFHTMQVAISQAESGNKSAIGTFDALGISVNQLRGLKADEQLELIADRLVALQSVNDRTRAGTELFGKAWQELGPFMLEGAAGIRRAREQVQSLGGALSEADIQNLFQADDAIKRLTISWDGFKRSVTAGVAPALVGILASVIPFWKDSGYRTALSVHSAGAHNIQPVAEDVPPIVIPSIGIWKPGTPVVNIMIVIGTMQID